MRRHSRDPQLDDLQYSSISLTLVNKTPSLQAEWPFESLHLIVSLASLKWCRVSRGPWEEDQSHSHHYSALVRRLLFWSLPTLLFPWALCFRHTGTSVPPKCPVPPPTGPLYLLYFLPEKLFLALCFCLLLCSIHVSNFTPDSLPQKNLHDPPDTHMHCVINFLGAKWQSW